MLFLSLFLLRTAKLWGMKTDSELESLDLGSQNLSCLPEDYLKLYPNLRHLILDSNPFEALVGISALTNLEELSLWDTPIVTWHYDKGFHLPDELSQLTKLKILNFGYCSKFRGIPRCILKLAQLEVLMLNQTCVNGMGIRGIEQLTNLTTLNLACSRVDFLPDDFYKLTQLTELNLSTTLIREFATQLCELTNLRKLNFADTRVSDLPQEFGKLSHLVCLDFSLTKVSSLPRVILEFQNLEIVSVCETPFWKSNKPRFCTFHQSLGYIKGEELKNIIK
jgi:Leucine-rich repeat (LRR) protein